jgi:hypothetical protein
LEALLNCNTLIKPIDFNRTYKQTSRGKTVSSLHYQYLSEHSAAPEQLGT